MKKIIFVLSLASFFPLKSAEAKSREKSISTEFNICLAPVMDLKVNKRRVIDVDVADVELGNIKASIAVDAMGIGKYSRAVEELGLAGQKYREGGVTFYLTLYDKSSVVAIGRKVGQGTLGSAWVYVTVHDVGSASSAAATRLMTALHECPS